MAIKHAIPWRTWALIALIWCANAAAADLSDPAYRAEVAKQFPGVTAEDITPSAIPGLWQVMQSGVLAYVTADGHYLLVGDLIDLKADINLTEGERRQWRLVHLAKVDEADMIVYTPANTSHTISIFTDVECHYCRTLHEHMDQFLAAGIKVRYLAYPLAGPDTSAFQRAEHVWCAADRKQALTEAFRRYAEGEPALDDAECDNPVMAQLRLAAKTLGLIGTPSIVTEDGRLLAGGLPVPLLIKKINGG